MNIDPPFLPGMDLAAAFFEEVVGPLLAQGYPQLRYSAGLVGSGSEVLGFDTALSTDHHWGPRVMIFLTVEDLERRSELEAYFASRLPPTFRGWSTHWGPPDEIGVRLLAPAGAGQPIAHRVEFMNWDQYLEGYLGDHPTSQQLRTLRYGRLFHDQLGLDEAKERYAFYPHERWIEEMASVWHDISEEEPFIGRCSHVGDERGSRLVAARLVELAMRLAFLQEREYAPYSKWFGTAFGRLAAARVLGPLVDRVLGATEGEQRQQAFHAVGEFLAKQHNGLRLTPFLPEEASSFWGRPYRVIHGDRFAAALRALRIRT